MNGHVVIVGGGISGTATAYELARNGVSVVSGHDSTLSALERETLL